jgi:predicted DNA-binding transcriptional regulator AlpA
MAVFVEKSPKEKEFLNQIDAAELLDLHVNTLVALSKRPDGPPRSKITPRIVRYKRSELMEWMASRREKVAA